MARLGSYSNILLSKSLEVSGNNLSADTDKYIFVKPGNADDTVVPAAEGDMPMGVSWDIAKHGSSIAVAVSGIVKIRLAGTVARSDPLKVTSGTTDGRAVKATDNEVHGAIALQSGASGEVISALLSRGIGASIQACRIDAPMHWKVDSSTIWSVGWWQSANDQWWLLVDTSNADSFVRSEADFYIPLGDIRDVPSS